MGRNSRWRRGDCQPGGHAALAATHGYLVPRGLFGRGMGAAEEALPGVLGATMQEGGDQRRKGWASRSVDFLTWIVHDPKVRCSAPGAAEANSSRSALAARRSSIPKPSVNQS